MRSHGNKRRLNMSHPVWLEGAVIVAATVFVFAVGALVKFWRDFDCMHSAVHTIENKLDEIGFMTAAMLDHLQVPMREEEDYNAEMVKAWDEAD